MNDPIELKLKFGLKKSIFDKNKYQVLSCVLFHKYI